MSISLDDIRAGGASRIAEILSEANNRQIVIVNGAHSRDLDVFVDGLVAAEQSGKRFLYRTGPSFVAARAGQSTHEALQAETIFHDGVAGNGLVIVGSHTTTTRKQLDFAHAELGFALVQLRVDRLLSGGFTDEVERVSSVAREFLAAGDTVIATSGDVQRGRTAAEQLQISERVSFGVVAVVRRLLECTQPAFIVGKGGITSADLATRAFEARSATVLGQLFPGQISVWRMDSHPKVPFVVFPGNVGNESALRDVLQLIHGR